jgi:hypothetical protein
LNFPQGTASVGELMRNGMVSTQDDIVVSKDIGISMSAMTVVNGNIKMTRAVPIILVSLKFKPILAKLTIQSHSPIHSAVLAAVSRFSP